MPSLPVITGAMPVRRAFPFSLRKGFGLVGMVALGGYLDRYDFVALLDGVDHFHPFGHAPEDCVQSVEPGGRLVGDEKLRAARVRSLGLGHAEDPAVVFAGVYLVANVVAGSTGAVSLGVAALDHKVFEDPVERKPVIVALLGQ